MQRLKERLVSRRNNLNLSQVELAERAGIAPRSIAAYETGESQPTHKMLLKLADALKVSVAWLVGGEIETHIEHFQNADSPEPQTPKPHLEILPVKVLEDLFRSLGDELKKSGEPDRSKIMESLNAVHAELKRRAASTELILHKKGPKPPSSSPLTDQEKAALAAFSDKVQPGDDAKSSPASGAASPRPHSKKPSTPSSPGSKSPPSAHATKEQK
jgi:transcriptional regulator with XRE-family HTH domain